MSRLDRVSAVPLVESSPETTVERDNVTMIEKRFRRHWGCAARS